RRGTLATRFAHRVAGACPSRRSRDDKEGPGERSPGPRNFASRVTYGAGWVIVACCSAIWVCASALPFMVAPVCRVMAVFERMTPSKCEFAPTIAWPATCQKMFFACAPPLSVTLLAAAMVRSPLVWKIQTSLAPPEMVTLEGMVTVLVHL